MCPPVDENFFQLSFCPKMAKIQVPNRKAPASRTLSRGSRGL